MNFSFHRKSGSRPLVAALLGIGLHVVAASAAPPSTQSPSPQPPASAPQIGPAQTSHPAAEEDILDIRGPIHIPAEIAWTAWVVGVLATCAVGIAAWKLLRRPRRKLPHEIALDQLHAARALMNEGNARPFSLAVSEVVRLFIERCFPVRAAHRTTHEFLSDLVNLPGTPLAGHRDTLALFLEHCDLAKFARWSLTVPQMEAMITSASAFVIAVGRPASVKKQSEARPAPAIAVQSATANS